MFLCNSKYLCVNTNRKLFSNKQRLCEYITHMVFIKIITQKHIPTELEIDQILISQEKKSSIKGQLVSLKINESYKIK